MWYKLSRERNGNINASHSLSQLWHRNVDLSRDSEEERYSEGWGKQLEEIIKKRHCFVREAMLIYTTHKNS